MKSNNIKKIIGSLAMALFVSIGFSISERTVANANSNNEEVVLYELDNEGYELFGYDEYGEGLNNDDITLMVKNGIISKEEGDLDLKFLNSKSEEEKNNVYKEIIDNMKDQFKFSDKEVFKLKNAGYKNYGENIDRIYYERMVENGQMTQEEMEIEIKLTGAKNKEEREEAYKLYVDNLVNKKEITKEQGDKLKEAGYDKYMKNIDNVE